MSRRIEIKLALPIVMPLIARLRAQVASLEDESNSAPAGEKERGAKGLSEVTALLELFHPDFVNTGIITVTSFECPVVLRACSFLRLRLRKKELSGIPEDALQSILDSAEHPSEEREFAMLYAFLATLQEVLIEQIPLLRQLDFPLWEKLSSGMRRLFQRGGRSAAGIRPSVAESWEVVVLDDPVNLMSYVTSVFQSVFSFPKDAAQQHMREVHESKSARVWVGSQEKAEAYASVLRSWHLHAIARKNG
jgi:ATP-dependent Clp protease adaptor protein ClpS